MKTLFLLLIILNILFNDYYLVIALGILETLFVVSVIYTFIMSKSVKYDWDLPALYYHKGDLLRVYFETKNKGLLPPIEFKFRYKNKHNKSAGFEFRSIDSDNQERVRQSFYLTAIGTYEIELYIVRVHDFFKIIYFDIPANLSKTINVYPVPSNNVNMEYVDNLVDNGETSVYERGEDYTEIFSFHEYRENEPFKHIHPNLSAKYDEYIVKEASYSKRKTFIYELKNYNQLSKYESKLSDIFRIFQTVVLDRNDNFIIKKEDDTFELFSNYDLYRLMDTVYKECL